MVVEATSPLLNEEGRKYWSKVPTSNGVVVEASQVDERMVKALEAVSTVPASTSPNRAHFVKFSG